MRITKKQLLSIIKEAVQEEQLTRMSDDDLASNILEVAEVLAIQVKDRQHGKFAQSALRKYARELLVLTQEAIKRQDAVDPSGFQDVDNSKRRSGSVDEQMAKGNGLVTTTAAQQSEKSQKEMVVEEDEENC